MLCASVLAVVGAAPAGAVNTASEVLVDHDRSAATPAVRQFAGADRYATAVAVAKRFTDDANATGIVVAAIVVSGENLLDAASAAGLAAAKTAPILLTRRDSLPAAVAAFLDDRFISEIYVIGSESSVSDRVLDALAAVDSVASVKRLSGIDPYATAAVVADEVGSSGEYCSTGQRAAVLVNADSSFADVIVAGPLVFASGLPLLLTQADALPADIGGFLTDEEIERVVIVGGPAAVSEAVADDLLAAGVSDVERIEGANRYATSVAVLKAIGRCGGAVSLSSDSLALVNDAVPTDGLVAAPLLGQGLSAGAGGVTPVLLVGDGPLPADVAAYLSQTPARAPDGTYMDLRITAIGSTTAVSGPVVEAALAAARTVGPLSVTGVKVSPSGTTVTITFSGQVEDEDRLATSATSPAHYRIDGIGLLNGDAVGFGPNKRTIVIETADKVAPGVVVDVAGGAIGGYDGDNRRVAGFSWTVPKPPLDRSRPRVLIVAPENGNLFAVSVVEPNLVTERLTAVPQTILLNGDPLRDTYTSAAFLPLPDGANLYRICLHGTETLLSAPTSCIVPAPDDVAGNLKAGDRISIPTGLFTDRSGNTNRTTAVAVAANHSKQDEPADLPRALEVSVTLPTTYDSGTALAPNPQLAAWRWRDELVEMRNDDVIVITANADGPAGGAAGNGWYVDWFQTTPDDDDVVGEATVEILQSRKSIRIGYDEDATVYTVLAALGDHDGFNESFTVASAILDERSLDRDMPDLLDVAGTNTHGPVSRPGDVRRALSGGESSVRLTLRYNDILNFFEATELREHNQGADNYPAAAGWPPPVTDPTGGFLSAEATITLHSGSLSELPAAGDSIRLGAGIAANYDGVGSAEEPQRRLRPA
ncbi:MAG TPA: hypothetical protein DEP66_01965 [Acidimicrobiaceae bacterium]|nr:hypothetical protein [Acidimicrobiaceae bacterium]